MTEYPFNHLARISHTVPEPDHTFQLYDGTGSNAAFHTDYIYEVSVKTYDGLIQEVGTVTVYASELNNLDRPYSEVEPDPPYNLSAADFGDDNGHKIAVSFSGVSNMSYYIGRATNSQGPYVCIHSGSLNPGTYYDEHVQDGVEYFYKVLRIDAPFPYGPYPSAFAGPVSAVSENELTPAQIPTPDADDGNYDMVTETVNMSWDPPNLGTNPDVAGYWVCPIFPDNPPRSLIIHASPIDRTTFRAPLDFETYQGDEVIYYIAAMDYSGNIGQWSAPISIIVGTYIALSTSAEATATNNNQKFIRIVDTNELWLTYASDGYIYAAKSTDEGATWTIKQLGRGFYPAISCNFIAETPRPSVIWQFEDEDAGIHYIYFSRYLGNDTWTEAQMIQAGASGTTFGPPSFAIGICDTGHVVYAATSGGTSTVKYTKFYLFNPMPSIPQDVGTGTNPSIAYMTSTGKPPIHVAWVNSNVVYYRSRSALGWAGTENVSGIMSSKQPSLEVVGNNVYVAWAENTVTGDIYWRYKVYTGPFGVWMLTKRVCNTPSTASTYPVLTGGYSCAWVEQIPDAFDMYYSHYDELSGTWSTPVSISTQSKEETFSNYPHIAHKQTLDSTRIYFVWTEGTGPNVYPIKYKTYDIGGGKEAITDALPYYVAYGGEEEPSPFNRRRDGYEQYGNEPCKRIDKASANSCLEYQFETLDPDRIYDLTAYLYQRGSTNLTLSAKIDNILLGTITLPPDSLVTLNHVIPTVLYKDNSINVKIIGNNNQAVSAILALHKFEKNDSTGHKQANGNGPQEIGSKPLTGYQLTLTVQPTHTTRSLTIKYTLPQTERVRIALFDVSGRLVNNLVNDALQPGAYTHTCDTGNLGLSRGVYFVRLETGDNTLVQKAVVVK